MISFSTIIAIIKAIPAIKSMFDDLVAFYIREEIASMKAGNRAAIRKAITDHDQRPIEDALGNPNSGKISNATGSQIRDDFQP